MAVRAQDAPLKFWQFYAPGGDVAARSHGSRTWSTDWNDSHDQKVELDYVVNNEYMDGTKLPTAFASGEGPDLFIISPGDFLRYYNGGVLLDLTPFIEEQAKADFPEGVIANRMVDGKIYGLPMEVEPMAMYYSVKAFEEAGLNENDVRRPGTSCSRLAKKLTTPERYGVLFETTPGYYQNFTWYPFMWQGGGEFQTADGKSAFNSPATVQALKFWQDAVNAGAAPRQALAAAGGTVVANLGSGYCAMQNVGIWAIAELRQHARTFNTASSSCRRLPGGKYVTVGGGWAFVANAKGKNPEAAGSSAPGRSPRWTRIRSSAWSTGARWRRATCRREHRAEGGRALFEQGFLGSLHQGDLSGHARRAAGSAEVYKIISDAIQAAQLGGETRSGGGRGSQQLDAFLAGLLRRAHTLAAWTSREPWRTLRAPAVANDRRRSFPRSIANGSPAISSSCPTRSACSSSSACRWFWRWPRLLRGRRLRRLPLRRPRQLSPHAGRPAVLAEPAGHAHLRRPAGARALRQRASALRCWCSGPTASTGSCAPCSSCRRW